MRNAQLWFEDGQLVGMAWPSQTQVDLIPRCGRSDIDAMMLTWSEQTLLAKHSGEQPTTHYAWSFTGDQDRIGLLHRRGYQIATVALSLRGRSLAGALPSKPIAPGYTVRHVHGPEEHQERVDLHRDAFAPSRMTMRYYTNAIVLPTYRQDLDLVAMASDGSLAAFCIAWFDPVNRIGVFEPVGCHSAHRRRGLASAVMIEGMRRLQRLGAVYAHVSSVYGADAEPLYESLGFATIDVNQRYARDLTLTETREDVYG
jgi:GNAT superfamily N-acetyltransferase